MTTAIEFENISKQYRLGLVSTGTLSHDLNRFWQTKVLRRDDPYLKVGETNDRAHKGNSDYVWALKDINFKVEQGDVVGIIGRNGAGKSTLLKLLSRVTTPTTGTIRARGRIASLLEVGTGFHPEMTGRENIYMNGAIMGMSRGEINRKLDEIVDFSGCERYLDTPVKRYSSGMTVRLGFAIAAHLEPEILVVDEVLAVGDAEFQKKAVGKMQDVSRGEGRTVLFVSHNMGAVRNLCNNGVVLKDGQLGFIGAIDDSIEFYMKSNMDAYASLNLIDMPRGMKTNDKIKFTQLQFFDKNDKIIERPHCGQLLKIRLSIIVCRGGVKSANVSIGIRNLYGDSIMSFPTTMVMEDFPLNEGPHIIDLIIPKLPLTAGSYRIGLWAGSENNEPADYLNNTIRMEVENDDFFGFGKELERHHWGKVVLCEHDWNIQ